MSFKIEYENIKTAFKILFITFKQIQNLSKPLNGTILGITNIMDNLFIIKPDLNCKYH